MISLLGAILFILVIAVIFCARGIDLTSKRAQHLAEIIDEQSERIASLELETKRLESKIKLVTEELIKL